MKSLIIGISPALGGKYVYNLRELVSAASGDLAFARAWAGFEAMEARNGVLFYFYAHYDRFIHSCRGMEIPVTPFMSKAEMENVLKKFIKKTRYRDACVGLFASRGKSPDNRNPKGLPYVRVDVWPFKFGVCKPLKLITSNELTRSWPRIKSTDGYGKTCALQERVQRVGYDSFIYWDAYYGLKEEAFSNIFFVTKEKKPRLITPAQGILLGVTRAVVLSLARKHKSLLFPGGVEEMPLHLKDLPNCGEAFITSTTKGIALVRQIDDYLFQTGEDTLTHQLNSIFLKHREDYFESHYGA